MVVVAEQGRMNHFYSPRCCSYRSAAQRVGGRERERGRERETEREGGKKERQREREREKERGREKEREREQKRQTHKPNHKQTNKQTESQTNSRACVCLCAPRLHCFLRVRARTVYQCLHTCDKHVFYVILCVYLFASPIIFLRLCLSSCVAKNQTRQSRPSLQALQMLLQAGERACAAVGIWASYRKGLVCMGLCCIAHTALQAESMDCCGAVVWEPLELPETKCQALADIIAESLNSLGATHLQLKRELRV